mgnify:CR=1 FL=1
MDKRLLAILRCPVTHKGLQLAKRTTLKDVNAAIDAGKLCNRDGRLLAEPLSEALGTPLPCPDSMLAALGTVLMPEGGPVATSVFDGDLLHTSLLEDYGIQVPVFNWSHHGRRYLRVSAHLYNHIDEYHYLADALRDSA